MSIAFLAKRHLTGLPYPVGWLVAQVPYAYRPGAARIYRLRRQEILALAEADLVAKQQFVLSRVRRIASYAANSVPFYRDLYRRHGVDPDRFQRFDDLQRLPIITKSDLQAVPLDRRSTRTGRRSLVNTGGTSGQPLDFYIEPSSVPHEWAHMYDMWRRIDYREGDLRIVFGGRAGITDALRYDGARHQWDVNIQLPWPVIADRLLELLERRTIRFMHGYPSAIFDFVLWAQEAGHPVLDVLRSSVRGLILSSEQPSPALRQHVDALLSSRSLSFYGHTERAVLAGEDHRAGQYRPYLTYGFAEAVEADVSSRLVATSYYNRASPLIRYDTGDLVHADVRAGLVEEFSIDRGRQGEFILDARGNKVFLTALIFGRHHELFGLARHVQVHQVSPGAASILIVPRRQLSEQEAEAAFDANGVDVQFTFLVVEEPRRTASGKVPLLVR